MTLRTIETDIPAQMDRLPWSKLPSAVGNFAGPLLLGRFFDTIGRKPMIAGTYILSGVEAARRDLEDIAPRLSATEEELEEPGEEADPYTLGRGEGRGAEHAPRFGRDVEQRRPASRCAKCRRREVTDDPRIQLYAVPRHLDSGCG